VSRLLSLNKGKILQSFGAVFSACPDISGSPLGDAAIDCAIDMELLELEPSTKGEASCLSETARTLAYVVQRSQALSHSCWQ